jgi:protein-S-isoprenylcysteine O-methyltransferase Ste14
MTSPLWYRARGSIFALIFLAGFLAGRGLPGYIAAGSGLAPGGTAAAMAAALLFMLAAYALRVWGAGYLNARTVWELDARTDALITAGPFAFTRNPLYLGNVLMAIGFGALAPLWGWAFIVVACSAYVLALIRWEEFALRMRYGAEFDAYARSVPALLPRIVPAASPAAVQFSLRQGLLAEMLTAWVFLGMFGVLFGGRSGGCIFLGCFMGGRVGAGV